MGFDIHFFPSRGGGKPVERISPFTGKQMITVIKTLSSDEVTAVRKVLKGVNAHGPDSFDRYTVDLEDGGNAEVNDSDLETTGCTVVLRILTPDLARFLYDLLKAATWVMVPVMEDHVAIAASPESAEGITGDYPKFVVCNSATELGALLTGGVQAWQKYRDQIVEGD